MRAAAETITFEESRRAPLERPIREGGPAVLV
jgi:hypothetical protein